MEAVTELIIAGEFDTEMVEETIQNQEGKNPDYIPKKSNEITPDRIRKPIASNYTPRKKKEKSCTPISRFRQNPQVPSRSLIFTLIYWASHPASHMVQKLTVWPCFKFLPF